MNSNPSKKSILLFDSAGRSYRFDDEEEVSRHRVDARSCSGVAAAKSSAPAEIARQRPTPEEEPEVSGRHFDPKSEFYHTTWEWGNLDFDGQDDLAGSFFCCHAHFSPVDARAYYDPSCDMIPVESEDAMTDADGFAVAF